MQTSTHLVVATLAGTFSGRRQTRKRDLLCCVVAMEAPDLIEYALYLGVRRPELLRQFGQEAIQDGPVSAYRGLKSRWHQREFTGFWLHNTTSLAGVAPLLGWLAVRGRRDDALVSSMVLAHAAMDMIGDLRAVGHLGNWAGQEQWREHQGLLRTVPIACAIGAALAFCHARRL